MASGDKIPVIISNTYGSFKLSKEMKDEYTKRREELLNAIPEEDSKLNIVVRYDDLYRHSPLMADIVNELQSKMESSKRKLKVEYVDRRLRPYIRINEYDGLESIDLNSAHYRLDEISKVVENTGEISSDEQIKKIKVILNLSFH